MRQKLLNSQFTLIIYIVCVKMWRLLVLNYYFVVCNMEAIGLATGGAIPDSSFTASSYYDSRYQPSYGRLHGNNRGWAPKTTTNPADFLQVDLLYEYIICAVATQGANGINEWTTKYKIQLSLDGITFFTYKENNIDKVGLHKDHAYVCTY